MEEHHVVAFFFDSGCINDSFYGDAIFHEFFKGKEIVKNSRKVVFSLGDILDRAIFDDVSPFLVRDDFCTVTMTRNTCKDYIFCYIAEDIDESIALQIDRRMKSDFPAYLGMTSIDTTSADQRKQFWKSLIRVFNVEYKTITAFGTEEEGGFSFSETAKKLGYKVNLDGFEKEIDQAFGGELYSTRQSTFIRSSEQLEVKDGKNDAERGINEMNFSLVKETGIAGVQIWKSIEDLNLTYTPHPKGFSASLEPPLVTDYLFTSLYQAAQGVERLLKILIELINYKITNLEEKKKVTSLLYGHNHPAMFAFISDKKDQLYKVKPFSQKF